MYNAALEAVRVNPIPDPYPRPGYDLAADLALIVEPCDTLETVRALVVRIACAVPLALQRLWLEHGAISMGPERNYWGPFYVWSATRLLERLTNTGTDSWERLETLGFVETIEDAWGGRPEFEETLTVEQIAQLNANYKVFALLHEESDEAHRYLYFDRTGGFGSALFHQDFWEEFQTDTLEPLLNGARLNQSLEDVLVPVLGEGTRVLRGWAL